MYKHFSSDSVEQNHALQTNVKLGALNIFGDSVLAAVNRSYTMTSDMNVCYNGGLFHAVDTPVNDVVLRWFGHAIPMRR